MTEHNYIHLWKLALTCLLAGLAIHILAIGAISIWAPLTFTYAAVSSGRTGPTRSWVGMSPASTTWAVTAINRLGDPFAKASDNTVLGLRQWSGFGMRIMQADSGPAIGSDPESHEIERRLVVVHVGWPLRAMQCSGVAAGGATVTNIQLAPCIAVSNGLHSPRIHGINPLPRGRIIPVQPLWFGTVVNILFYSIIVAIASVALTGARAAMRRYSGKCVHCSYDLSGHSSLICPECGRRVGRGSQRRELPRRCYEPEPISGEDLRA
jgi:hypothetical protein